MTKEQLAELRKLAEEAIRGAWVAAGPSNGEPYPIYCNEVVVDCPDSDMDGETVCSVPHDSGTEDMCFIAAFNPITAIALLDRIAVLEKEAANKAQFSLTTSCIMTRYIHAMQAAVIASRTNGAEAGMVWIENTLCGPGHLPDGGETNAQEFFDTKIKELEEFRAKRSAE